MKLQISTYRTFSGTKEILEIPPKYVWIILGSGVLNSVAWYFYFEFLQQGGNFTQGLPIMMVFLTIICLLFLLLITLQT